MSIVTSSQARNLRNAAAGAGALVSAEAIARQLVPYFRRYLNTSSESIPTGRSQAIPFKQMAMPSNANVGGGKRRRRPPKGRRAGGGSNMVPRIVAGSGATIRMSLRGMYNVNNTAVAGVANFAMVLAAVSNTAYPNLSNLFSQLTNYASSFTQYTLNRLTVTWVPNTAYTTSGSVVAGVDPDVGIGLPGAYASCVVHKHFFMTDLKEPAKLVWTPQGSRQKEPCYLVNSGTKPETELSFGVLQMYSSGNSIAANTIIGQIFCEGDFTFMLPG